MIKLNAGQHKHNAYEEVHQCEALQTMMAIIFSCVSLFGVHVGMKLEWVVELMGFGLQGF